MEATLSTSNAMGGLCSSGRFMFPGQQIQKIVEIPTVQEVVEEQEVPEVQVINKGVEVPQAWDANVRNTSSSTHIPGWRFQMFSIFSTFS